MSPDAFMLHRTGVPKCHVTNLADELIDGLSELIIVMDERTVHDHGIEIDMLLIRG